MLADLLRRYKASRACRDEALFCAVFGLLELLEVSKGSGVTGVGYGDLWSDHKGH